MHNFSPLELAGYILASYPDTKITPMKLQKLAFYTKVWTLVAGIPFVDAVFARWPYGPVNHEIYTTYKKFGKNPIVPPPHLIEIPSNQKQLFKFILDNYIKYPAVDLSAMTHQEKPWLETAKGATITDESIINYYGQLPFAKNFADLDSLFDNKFYVLQTDSWHAFTMDMSVEDASEFESYSSYKEYERVSSKASKDINKLMVELFGYE